MNWKERNEKQIFFCFKMVGNVVVKRGTLYIAACVHQINVQLKVRRQVRREIEEKIGGWIQESFHRYHDELFSSMGLTCFLKFFFILKRKSSKKQWYKISWHVFWKLKYACNKCYYMHEFISKGIHGLNMKAFQRIKLNLFTYFLSGCMNIKIKI